MGPVQATAELGVPPEAAGAVLGDGGGAVVGAVDGLAEGEPPPAGVDFAGVDPAWLPGAAQALSSRSRARAAIGFPVVVAVLVGGTAETLA